MKYNFEFINTITIFSFVVLIFNGQGILAQNQEDFKYVVDFITVKEGLSHNYSTSIESDDLNMKWIGTENGITKYNGYDFEYIKPGKNYENLLNENIETLFIDENSILWIGTKSGGLTSISIKNRINKNYNYLIDVDNKKDLRITAISQDRNGNMWIGTWDKGVFVINIEEDKLIRHFNYNQQIYSISKDYKGNMWFSSGKKAYGYNLQTNSIKVLSFNHQVSDIISDKFRKKIWISTSNENQYIYAYNWESDKLEDLYTGVTSNFSKKLLLDHKNRIWIGTWGKGVYRSDAELKTFKKIKIVSEDSEKIVGNYRTILDIHEDNNNIIWLTTASGGLVKLIESTAFKNIAQLSDSKKFNEKLNTTSLLKTNDKIFVGTLFSGLYYSNDFKDFIKVNEIGDVKINTLYQYGENLFIGEAFGFHVLNLKTNKIVFSTDKIRKATAFLIHNNYLYIGTQQDGMARVRLDNYKNPELYQFYSKNEEENFYLPSNRITSIKKDFESNIWVSTYNGLHLFEISNEKFKLQDELIKDNFQSIIINAFEIKGNLIWLSTPNGLLKLSYKNKTLTYLDKIDKKNGLNSDFICSATFDNLLNLWISTHTGIVKYNDSDKSLINYGNINGIETTLFNNNSYYNYNNETIFFGGIDNITFFNPKEIKDFSIIPEVVLTGLSLKNKSIEYHSESNYINQDINYANRINLTHKDDFFSVRFVANDFLGKLNVNYRYKLEKYKDEWVELDGMNEVNFTGLPPGNYTLNIQTSRNNNNWSSPKSIEIFIKQSPWKSLTAFIIYAIILIGIVSYFVIQYNYKTRLKNKLEIAKLDKKKKVEIAESKLNFFTNISHEFRTPLTLISSPIKELLEYNDLPQKVYKNLNYIDKNTTRLLNLVNQLLDFRKADYGILKLKASYGNFVRFSNEVFLYFSEAAKSKNIKYTFNATKEDITFPFDRNKMEIVLCNILSNAIKFTEKDGEINFNIEHVNDKCTITIKDNGIGIDAKQLDKIFDRFFQIENAKTAQIVGSGIGLTFSKKIVELHHGNISVESKEKSGTTFIIKLSTNPQTYQGEIDESFKKTDDIDAYDTQNLGKHVNENYNDSKLTILLVDDNKDILEYLSDILNENFKVLTAIDGEKGINKALKHSPDLIVSDVMMPVKDGIALCKELKSNIVTSHIPIILLTARTSNVYEIEGLEHGADDYVKKPFNASVIKARINSILDNRNKIKSHFLNKIRFEPSPIQTDKNDDPETKFIQKAIKLVEDNLQNESFGIEYMTEELNMSRSSLFRKIKSLTGMSLSAFIRSIRVKKAAKIILTEDLSLKEIAYEVGFNTYKYFKVSFEKQFDCLPSSYKEKHKEQHS